MRILTGPELRSLVPMADAIDVVGDAFAQLATGRAQAPLRLVASLPGGAVALAMPGLTERPAAFSVKTVMVHPDNPKRGLPRVQALVVALDPTDGRALGVIEGTTLTALRTGAASGVATRLLARNDAARVALFGAGPQAWTQVEALDAVRELSSIDVVSRAKATAAAFAKRLRKDFGVESRAADPSVVHHADIIVAATNSKTPVFRGKDAAEGVHANGIGSFTAQMREVDVGFLARVDKIVVDDRDAAWAEAGELIAARKRRVLGPKSIYATLGELCAGKKNGRARDDEITYFKSVGNAVQDAAVAGLALERAERKGVGTVVEL